MFEHYQDGQSAPIQESLHFELAVATANFTTCCVIVVSFANDSHDPDIHHFNHREAWK